MAKAKKATAVEVNKGKGKVREDVVTIPRNLIDALLAAATTLQTIRTRQQF